MNRPIRILAMGVFAIFIGLIGAVTYHQLIVGPDYRDDPRNVRVATGRTGRERGTIITADGVVVAVSEADPDDPLSFRRSYPEGELYGHTVGYTTLLFGSQGIEAVHTEDLVSNRDATISGVIAAILGGDVRPKGLRLTLEHDLQLVAREALGDQRGAVVALDPSTGAILAMVSTPEFDPNLLIGGNAGPAGQALEDDPGKPLLNRATAASYPPGSTFKVITAAAAFESGVASSGTPFPNPVELELPGSTATISNFNDQACGPGSEVPLSTAFINSCNTIFGMLGMEVGAEQLVATAESFGFNSEIPLDIRTIASVIPPADSFEFDVPGVAQSAIGQRDVRATPLQMALTAAAVANDGEIMVPYLVEEIFNADGVVEESAEPVTWLRATSPGAATALADLMEGVVTSGTGRRASVPGTRIAGKTGTAEVPEKAPHAWFIGFGPVGAASDERQIALAVLVESGGDAGEAATGGTVAAPIAQAVFAEFFDIQQEGS
ncbi:MAG: penicillin-binding transpeptidase domain-containing protein [Actinomycetota bacterium]|nr:penicillin-binding transpeptidase domain-containing protein [Actinomycetota bacterium]